MGGEDKKYPRLTVYFRKDKAHLYWKLKELADRTGKSMSEIVIEALEAYLGGRVHLDADIPPQIVIKPVFHVPESIADSRVEAVRANIESAKAFLALAIRTLNQGYVSKAKEHLYRLDQHLTRALIFLTNVGAEVIKA